MHICKAKGACTFLSNQELAECVCGSLSGVSERCAFRDAEMKKSGIVIDVNIAL